MKKLAISTIIATTVMASSIFCAEYPTLWVVSQIDYENDIVICVDFNGFEWEFEGCEDWTIGDYCSVIMEDMETKEIFDDKMVMCRYSGWLSGGFGLTENDEFVIESN